MPKPRHRRWALAVGLPLILVIIGVMIIPATTRNSLARWLTPWRNVERYTFAQLDGNPDLRVVAYAEPFDVKAQLKDESRWKPESGQAQYAKQKPIVAERDGTSYKFELPPQTEDGKIKLRVGDARRSIPVEPKLRPALKELVATVQLPEYLQREEPQVADVRGGTVNLVKGSTATLEATTTRELSEATLNNRPQKVDGATVITEPISVATTTEMQLTWRDRFGLTAKAPQVLQFDLEDDATPTVAIKNLKNNQVVVSSEVLSFEIQAGDDFGVKQVGLEWEGIPNPVQNPEPASGEKTVSSGSPTSEDLNVTATFSTGRENVKPQSLRLRAYVEDYFPERGRIYSPQIVLHVLSPAEHFKWLIGQMRLWAGAAKDVHDKELQLHQINKELSSLPPEALDDPAQRKKLQNQAAEEKANAAKLDSLIDSGEALIQEAAKNSEFDGEQIESWGDMLEKLEEIAGQKMPSVANLLAQASDAQGQASQSGKPSDPNQQNQSPSAESQPSDGKPGEQTDPNQQQQMQSGQSQSSSSKSGESKDDIEKYGPDNLIGEKSSETANEEEDSDDLENENDSVNVDRSKPPQGDAEQQGDQFTNPYPGIGDIESGFNLLDDPQAGPG